MNDAVHLVCPHCAAVSCLAAARLHDQPVCGKCARALLTAHPVDVNAATFLKYLQRNDIALLVDFWAPWCGPCRMMAPAYEQAAQRLEPSMPLLKLNTEQEQGIAAQHGIRSITTLVSYSVNSLKKSVAIDPMRRCTSSRVSRYREGLRLAWHRLHHFAFSTNFRSRTSGPPHPNFQFLPATC